MAKRKKIGLALGGGAAKGCAHVGVIRALEEAGISIDAVAGTSIGALIGGIYVAGGLSELESIAPKITKAKVISYCDFRMPVSALVKGKKVESFLNRFLPTKTFSQLPIPFVAVAADLKTAQEIRLRSGRILPAVRASISLPGVFKPVKKGHRYLVDGGLVNPVPVNVLREMGMDQVIAVDLNYHMEDLSANFSPMGKQLKQWVTKGNPLLFDVVYRSVMMIQRELTIKNFALDPADLVIRPRVGKYKSFDFHRAEGMIEAGYKAAKKALRTSRI